MHTAWLRSKGKLDECPVCLQEQANNPKPVNPFYGTQERFPVPCPKHGNPALILDGNQEAFDIYILINRLDAHIYREYKQGDKVVMKAFIDTNIAIHLCHELEVKDTFRMLEKLSIIHQELRG